MRSLTPARIAALMLVAVALAVFAVVAPASLGGSATWLVTSGNSMEPGIKAGALVIARPDSGYRVGDVVAYRSATLEDTVVLHRVVAQEPAGLTTKGDNNDWLDPDRPKSNEILGELWLHIPGGGRVLSAFTSPFVIAGVAVLLLTIGGGVTARRSKRRTRRASRTGTATPHSLVPAAVRQWAAVAGVAAVAVGLVAFGRAATTTASDKVGIAHEADLSYSAAANKPGIYSGNRIRTGDPIFIAAAPVIDTHLDYRLTTSDAKVTGSVDTRVELSASNGWRRSIPLTTAMTFAGNHAQRSERVNLAAILQVARNAEKAAGTTFGAYTVEVVHDIHLKGTVANQPVDTTYRPKLTFTLDGVQAVLQGTKPASNGEPVTTTEHSDVAVAAPAPATITVVRWAVPVSALRVLSILLGITAAALAALAFTPRGQHDRPRELFGNRLVRASNADLGNRPVVDVHDAPTLARLAKQHDTLIVDISGGNGQMFLITVDGTTYRYAETQQPEHDHAAPAGVTP